MNPSEFPFSYGMNEYTTQPWSFEEDVENYVRLGVDTIEIVEDKLDTDRISSQLEWLNTTGLTISSVQPSVRTMTPSTLQPKPEDHEGRMARLRQSIETIAPYAPGSVFVTNTGPATGGNMTDTIRQVIKDHQELASIADQYGVKIALEPLNPVLLNLESAIWTYRQALDIVQEIDRENVGICLDLWNIWQDEHFMEGIQSAPDLVFLLHVSDWRTPKSSADRRSVGTGDIPIGQHLHEIYNAGYRGPCILEIFSKNVPDSLYDTDLNQLILDNRQALEQAWKDSLS